MPTAAKHYTAGLRPRLVCTKFNYKSNIRDPDWKILTLAFKRAYCEGCSAREPKSYGQVSSDR